MAVMLERRTYAWTSAPRAARLSCFHCETSLYCSRRRSTEPDACRTDELVDVAGTDAGGDPDRRADREAARQNLVGGVVAGVEPRPLARVGVGLRAEVDGPGEGQALVLVEVAGAVAGDDEDTLADREARGEDHRRGVVVCVRIPADEVAGERDADRRADADADAATDRDRDRQDDRVDGRGVRRRHDHVAGARDVAVRDVGVGLGQDEVRRVGAGAAQREAAERRRWRRPPRRRSRSR